MPVSAGAVLAERLRRQGLSAPATSPREYLALFALLQPVAPPFFCYPGSPPRMAHRFAGDQEALAGGLRERRRAVKGRFLGGNIGYVRATDLALYANAFCRPLPIMTGVQRRVYRALAAAGPLTPRQLSEETGLRNKEVMPALHRLQQAFLVYEDQLATDWDRGWYLFASEWPRVRLGERDWQATAGEVLLRFLHAHVFATTRQTADWSGWALREVGPLLARLQGSGAIVGQAVPGLGEGWLPGSDQDLPSQPVPPTVFMLDRCDPLVRSHARELKERYRGLEVLQYLLIDGAFQGAVLGHWRIGPHDVDDILVELPPAERAARRADVIQAVAVGYQPPYSRIRRYAGVDLG